MKEVGIRLDEECVSRDDALGEVGASVWVDRPSAINGGCGI